MTKILQARRDYGRARHRCEWVDHSVHPSVGYDHRIAATVTSDRWAALNFMRYVRRTDAWRPLIRSRPPHRAAHRTEAGCEPWRCYLIVCHRKPCGTGISSRS